MIELNERQKTICEDLGLPTSYDELTPGQKVNIVRIEQLLSYLDTKYGTTFHYVGYYQPTFNMDEKLEAYSDAFNEYEFTTLEISKDSTYTDNYPFTIARRLLWEDLVQYLTVEGNLTCKAFALRGETKLQDISSISIDTISGCSWISFTVFVSGQQQEDAQKIGELLSQWYVRRGIYGSTNVLAVDDVKFREIDFENYGSVKRELDISNFVSCDVFEDGSVKIY